MSVKELNEASFEKAINADKVVVVDFYADWCGPCKMLKPVLDELSNAGHNIYSVNVDESKELAIKYHISSIPTVLFFKKGKQVDQFVGLKDDSEIEEIINKHS
jgi:thioredoxin 1